MSTEARACLERRRSTRFPMCIALTICGDEGLQEQTCAFSLNAHGTLIGVSAKVRIGQRLIIQNPENQAKRVGRVTRLGRCQAGKTEVGIEFTEAAPDFWLITDNSKNLHVG